MREMAHVLDEKSILASKIDDSWEIGDCIPHSVPTWFLLGSYSVPSPMVASKKGPLVFSTVQRNSRYNSTQFNYLVEVLCSIRFLKVPSHQIRLA